MTIIWNNQIHTFILHNPKSSERKTALLEWTNQLNTASVQIVNNIEVEYMNNTQKGAFGMAHILQTILQNQLFQKNQKVLILEDDVTPYPNINSINEILSKGIEVPDSTDALYFGCSHFRVHSTEDTHAVGPSFSRINDQISRIWNMLGTHAILINTETFAQNFLYTLLTSIAKIIQYDLEFARTLPFFEVYGLNTPLFVQNKTVGGQEHETNLKLSDYMESKIVSEKKSFISYLFPPPNIEVVKTIYLQNTVFIPIDHKSIHHAATIASIFLQYHNQKLPPIHFSILTTFNPLEQDFLSFVNELLPSGYHTLVKEWLFQNYIQLDMINDPAWKEFQLIYTHAHSSSASIILSHFCKLFMVHNYLYHHDNSIPDNHPFTILNPSSTFQQLPISFILSDIPHDNLIFCTPSHSPFILQKVNKHSLHRITEIIATSYLDKNIKQHIIDIRHEMEQKNHEGGIDLFTFFQWIQSNAWNFGEGFTIHKVTIPDIPCHCIQNIQQGREFILGKPTDIPQIQQTTSTLEAEATLGKEPAILTPEITNIVKNKELVDPIIIRPHFLGGKHTNIDRIYILQCLESIKFFHQNPKQAIKCIVNDRTQLINAGVESEWFEQMKAHIENFADYESDDYNKFMNDYLHLSTNHELFEKYSIGSYFLVREAMRKNGWSRAWIIETDTILLHSLADVQSMIEPPKEGMTYLTNNCTCCVAWVSLESIEKYCNVINESYSNDFIKQSMIDIYLDMRSKKLQGGINDMTFWDWIKRDCWGLNRGLQLNNIDIKLPDNSFFDYMIQETSKEYLETRGFPNQECLSHQIKALVLDENFEFQTKKLQIKDGKMWALFANNEEKTLIRSLQFQGHYKWLLITFWNSIRQKLGITASTPFSQTLYKLLPVEL